MVHQERLEIGEKSFVTGIMAVLATEAGLTVITNGLHFSWAGLLLGVAGFCLMLFLANRLYAGNRQAQRIALVWICFQLLYAVFALYLMVSSARGVETAKEIGAPAAWPVLFKAVVYLFLGWVLVRMPTVRDFFAEKRGDIRTHALLAHDITLPQEPKTSLNLTAEQTDRVRGLAQYLRWGVGALIALGILQVIASVVVFKLNTLQPAGLLVLVQGVLTMMLGMALGGPSNDVRPLTSPEEQTKENVLGALASLAKFFKVQIIVGLLLAVVIVARFVIVLW